MDWDEGYRTSERPTSYVNEFLLSLLLDPESTNNDF